MSESSVHVEQVGNETDRLLKDAILIAREAHRRLEQLLAKDEPSRA